MESVWAWVTYRLGDWVAGKVVLFQVFFGQDLGCDEDEALPLYSHELAGSVARLAGFVV